MVIFCKILASDNYKYKNLSNVVNTVTVYINTLRTGDADLRF